MPAPANKKNSATAIKILVVDGSAFVADLLRMQALEGGPAVVLDQVGSLDCLAGALQLFEPDLVVADAAVAGLPISAMIDAVQRSRPDCLVVVVADTPDQQAQNDALTRGVRDYLPKTDRARLLTSLRNAIADAQEKRARRDAERALHESETRFRLFMEYMPGAAYVKDLEGRYTFVNAVVEKILGKPAEMLIGRPLDELYPPQFAAAYRQNDQLALNLRQVVEVIEEGPGADGLHTFLSTKFPINGPQGQAVLIGGVSVDITERRREQRQLALLGHRHAVLGRISRLILEVEGKDRLLQDACRIAVEAAGARMAWIGFSDAGGSRVAPAAWYGHDAGYLAEVGAALEGDAEHRELTGWSVQFKTWDTSLAAQAARDNRVIVSNDIATDPGVVFRQQALARGYRSLLALPLNVHGEAVGVLTLFADEPGRYDDDEVNLLQTLAASVSFGLEHISSERQLSFVSWYDSLTELPNRALFVDRLSQLMSNDVEACGVSLLVFDLRRFREVNATLGRGGGDQVLKIFAGRLRSTFSGLGTVARLAGDRFAVAVRGTHIAALSTLNDERWDSGLASSMRIDNAELRVSFKVGISAAPADGNDPETLFRHAESALHAAKQARDVYAFYSAEMKARAVSRLELEARLRKAVEQRQFQLHYQPRLDLASRKMVGAEALIRWPDGNGTLLSADQFVPALEEAGLIVEVGRWTIEQAVSDIRWWQACGLQAPRVSINVSPLQLKEEDFVGKVLAALGGPAAAGLVDLEITERELDADMASITEKLRQLRELGMSVIMDDFGTGRSSLTLLARLPIDVVKVDRSFVADIEREPSARAIVSAVIGLARSLKIVALAEGIESEAVAQALQQLGCQQGQGFAFGKPQPAGELAKWLAPRSAGADETQ